MISNLLNTLIHSQVILGPRTKLGIRSVIFNFESKQQTPNQNGDLLRSNSILILHLQF